MSLTPTDDEGWDRWYFGGTPRTDDAVGAPARLGQPSQTIKKSRSASPSGMDALSGRHTIPTDPRRSLKGQRPPRRPTTPALALLLMAFAFLTGVLAHQVLALRAAPPQHAAPPEFTRMRTVCDTDNQQAWRLPCGALPAPTTRLGTQSPPVHT